MSKRFHNVACKVVKKNKKLAPKRKRGILKAIKAERRISRWV